MATTMGIETMMTTTIPDDTARPSQNILGVGLPVRTLARSHLSRVRFMSGRHCHNGDSRETGKEGKGLLRVIFEI